MGACSLDVHPCGVNSGSEPPASSLFKTLQYFLKCGWRGGSKTKKRQVMSWKCAILTSGGWVNKALCLKRPRVDFVGSVVENPKGRGLFGRPIFLDLWWKFWLNTLLKKTSHRRVQSKKAQLLAMSKKNVKKMPLFQPLKSGGENSKKPLGGSRSEVGKCGLAGTKLLADPPPYGIFWLELGPTRGAAVHCCRNPFPCSANFPQNFILSCDHTKKFRQGRLFVLENDSAVLWMNRIQNTAQITICIQSENRLLGAEGFSGFSGQQGQAAKKKRRGDMLAQVENDTSKKRMWLCNDNEMERQPETRIEGRSWQPFAAGGKLEDCTACDNKMGTVNKRTYKVLEGKPDCRSPSNFHLRNLHPSVAKLHKTMGRKGLCLLNIVGFAFEFSNVCYR